MVMNPGLAIGKKMRQASGSFYHIKPPLGSPLPGVGLGAGPVGMPRLSARAGEGAIIVVTSGREMATAAAAVFIMARREMVSCGMFKEVSSNPLFSNSS